MSDAALLEPLATLARTVGERLRARPRPRPARTLSAALAAFAEVDGPVSDELRGELARLRPGADWADELDTRLADSGEIWVTDAIDGAVQYLQGLPQWCVSLTLVRDRQPVAAVLHAPWLDETYAAAAGHGATRDGRAVRPSDRTDPAAAVVGTGQPPFAGEQPEAVRLAGRSLSAVLPRVGAVRNLGPTSWQIADTAAGRLDAFWQYGTDDANLLGPALIAREAGAVVTDTAGGVWSAGSDGFLAATPSLHRPLLDALRAAE